MELLLSGTCVRAGCDTQKFHPPLQRLPNIWRTICLLLRSNSMDHCRTAIGRNRWTPANGRDEPDTDMNPRVVLTKKCVLIETVEFAKPQCVACESHVYPFRLPALLRASLFPNSGSSAS